MKTFRARTLGSMHFCGFVLCAAAEPFHFTATADMRYRHSEFALVLQAVQNEAGGPGVFHVSPGDLDGRIWDNRAKIDEAFGADFVWYPVIGNHEEEDGVEMNWLRAEYRSGNGIRTPLKEFTNQDGPAGTVETTYTWDHGNAHFIALNEYWNGGTSPGSDVAASGDIVPALYDWLAADLAANTKPFVFVFGHEPAFPFHRHVGDSLDQYPARRDAFWDLLEAEGVTAYICGHTHYYSRYRREGGRVWQIDLGNAGNDSGDGYTFLDVTVGESEVRFDLYRDPARRNQWSRESWTVAAPSPTEFRIVRIERVGLTSLRLSWEGAEEGIDVLSSPSLQSPLWTVLNRDPLFGTSTVVRGGATATYYRLRAPAPAGF